jgi:mannose-6-phosphate isomerase
MGTHPSGPARVAGSDTTLKAWLDDHPEALGPAVTKRFGNDLPYLFKVGGRAREPGSRRRPRSGLPP